MEELKAGDVVQLKSGGPKMTLIGPGSRVNGKAETHYACTWFDDKKQPQFLDFPKETLKKVNENPGVPFIA